MRLKRYVYRVKKPFIIGGELGKKVWRDCNAKGSRIFIAREGSFYCKGDSYYDYIVSEYCTLSEMTVELLSKSYITEVL